MGKKLTLAVLLAVVMAVPAFASVQNVKVSGSISTMSVIRDNGNANLNRDRQNEVIAKTHLNVSADLTDNVSTNIGLLNERLWGSAGNESPADASSVTNSIDLETAYVTMKEFLYSPLTLQVGRQPLMYGNGLIIGQNTDRSPASGILREFSDKGNFDAVKAILSYNPLTVDLFASRIYDKNTIGGGVNGVDIRDNVNLYGVNANYKLGDKMSTVVEGYLFAKVDDSRYTNSTLAKTQNTYVPGLRVSTNPIEGLNVQLEGAYQTGEVYNSVLTTNQARHAYALQGMVNYALPVLKDMKPVVSAEYKYLSGSTVNGLGGNGTPVKLGKAWDAMYENQDTGRIFDAKGLADSNAQLAVLSAEITPLKDLTTKLSWNGLWTAEKPAYVIGSANSSKYLGSEVDADLTYAYTEDVKFGVSAGMFLTGKNAVVPNDKNASQLLSSVSVAF